MEYQPDKAYHATTLIEEIDSHKEIEMTVISLIIFVVIFLGGIYWLNSVEAQKNQPEVLNMTIHTR